MTHVNLLVLTHRLVRRKILRNIFVFRHSVTATMQRHIIRRCTRGGAALNVEAVPFAGASSRL